MEIKVKGKKQEKASCVKRFKSMREFLIINSGADNWKGLFLLAYKTDMLVQHILEATAKISDNQIEIEIVNYEKDVIDIDRIIDEYEFIGFYTETNTNL